GWDGEACCGPDTGSAGGVTGRSETGWDGGNIALPEPGMSGCGVGCVEAGWGGEVRLSKGLGGRFVSAPAAA
ncbi:MAG: hypothetical protein LBJ61_07405, partial [Deltaproteobacteria bacterium]|nr:hypothetical protein [Deltaproteobacteria bacterium]